MVSCLHLLAPTQTLSMYLLGLRAFALAREPRAGFQSRAQLHNFTSALDEACTHRPSSLSYFTAPALMQQVMAAALLTDPCRTSATEQARPASATGNAQPPAAGVGLSTQVFLSSFKVEEFGKQRAPTDSGAVPSTGDAERSSTTQVRAESAGSMPKPAADMTSGHCREMCERILKEIGQLVEEW